MLLLGKLFEPSQDAHTRICSAEESVVDARAYVPAASCLVLLLTVDDHAVEASSVDI